MKTGRYVLMLALLCARLKSQDPSNLQALCAEAMATDTSEPVIAKRYTSPRLTLAMQSPDAFLRFITNPATHYIDRIAAAYQGGNLIGPEDLPKLWTAIAALDAEPVTVKQPPCPESAAPVDWSAQTPFGGPPDAAGGGVQAAPNAIDYPLTLQARLEAPWQWQVRRALRVLNESVNGYYRDPQRYPKLVEAAWAWEPSDWWQSAARANALRSGPRNADWLRAMVKLALTDERAGSAAPSVLSVCCQDRYHFEELLHVAQIVILQRTEREKVAGEAAFWTARLARDPYVPSNPELKPLKTATGLLAVARWAMNGKLDAWTRYSSFASPVCEMVEEPPFRPDYRLDPANPQVASALEAFEKWFESHRAAYEKQAEAERPNLAALARELKLELK